jgi:phosphoglycolate phosphatase-like HAD superfamily hydrolase
MNVDDLVDAIACGDEVSRGKPDPALVELALDHLGGTPAVFATMIGDTPFDTQAAQTAGASAWGTLSGGHPRSSLIDAGCSAVVQSVGDIGRYFAPEKPPLSTVPAHP